MCECGMVLLKCFLSFTPRPLTQMFVPVGVLCSDVPTPARLQSFHQGIGTAEGFFWGCWI